jgi:hypothetical protein
MATKANPFDAIAKPKENTPKSKSSKITASVDPDIKTKVDLVIHHKAQITSLEAEKAEAEASIIDTVRPQQDAAAYAGNFSKSFLVEGNTGSLTYTTSDRFSVPKDEESLEAIQKLLGKKYDTFFETKRTVVFKAADNVELVSKIMDIIGKAGMEPSDVFEVTDQVVAKSDLDRNQYTLKEKELAIFRTLVKQNKPALK